VIVSGEHVARWVMDGVGRYTEGMVGIGWEVDGELVSGVAFENYNGSNMFGHQRRTKPPPKSYWAEVAWYIFVFCGVKRLTAIVECDNIRAIKLNKHIGFETEITLSDAGRHGDLLVMVLRADKCKPLKWKRCEALQKVENEKNSS